MIIKGSDWGGSRISTAQTCKRKYYHRWVRPAPDGTLGIVKSEDGTAATKGTIIHAGLQFYYSNLIKDPAAPKQDLAVGAILHAVNLIDKFNIRPELVGLMKDEIIAALDQYFLHYESDDLQPIATEVPVSMDIQYPDGTTHTHTGIIDLVANYMNGLFIVDHKTTSMSWDLLFKKYTFNLSLKGYCLMARPIFGKEVGVLVNGIRFKKNRALEVELQREPILFTPSELDEFKPTVLSVLNEIKACEQAGFWPKASDQCVQPWGTCEYFPLCKYDDPAMVETNYKPAGGKDGIQMS